MSDVVIRVEHLSKQYRLGAIGRGTLRDDVDQWLARIRGKPDPLLKIGAMSNGHSPSALSGSLSANSIWALQDVSFDVKQGEVVGIIGRNGAGKSTLLKILSRITAPTSGVVKVKGRIASLLEVGTGFHPELTGRENVYLNGAILGMKRAEIAKKFDEIVAFAEVEQFIDTPVKRYSSGMYVRLAFAVAAHLEPEILIVDEVLAVGDTAFQKKCLGKMGDVAKEGRTVLFVSHNMAAICTLCTNGVWISHGRLLMRAESLKVVESYLLSTKDKSTEQSLESIERRGNGSARIQQITWLGGNGIPVAITTTGSRAIIGFRYQAIKTPLGIRFAFGLINNLGEYCLHCSTYTLGQDLFLNNSEGWISCSFEKLPVMPGNYALNFMLQSKDGEILDYVQNATTLFVEEGDFYSSARMPPTNSGSVLTNYSYSVDLLG